MWSRKCDPPTTAEIPEGEYNLLQSVSNKPINVKLTDSCLKAFENYVSSGSNGKLSLEFSEGQGKLIIPTSTNKPRVFSFYMTSLKTEVECYKHDFSGEQILNLGDIGNKLTIRANEESYSTTKEKMNMVKEQEQKSTTKVLKSVGRSSRKSRFGANMVSRTNTAVPIKRNMTNLETTNGYRNSFQKFVQAEKINQELTPKNSIYGKLDDTEKEVSKKTTVKRTVASLENSSRYRSALQTDQEPAPKSSNSLYKKANDLLENTIHLLAFKPLSFRSLFTSIASISKQPNAKQLKDLLIQVADVDTSNQQPVYNLKEEFFLKVDVNWPKFTAQQKSLIQARLLENGIGKKGKKRTLAELSEVDVDNIVSNEIDPGVEDYSISGKKKRVSLVKNNTIQQQPQPSLYQKKPIEKPKPRPSKKLSTKHAKKNVLPKVATLEEMPRLHSPGTKEISPPQSLSSKEKPPHCPITGDLFHPSPTIIEGISPSQPATKDARDISDLLMETTATNKLLFDKTPDHSALCEGSNNQMDLQDTITLKEPLCPFSAPSINGGDRKKRSKWMVTNSGSTELNLTLKDVSLSGKKKRMSSVQNNDNQQKHCGDLIDSFDVTTSNASSMSDGQRKSHYKSTTPSNDENSKEGDSYCYDDYVAKFTAITCKAQRDEYYAAFQELYSLYKQLYMNVSLHTRRFDEYKLQYKRGSSCRNELKRTVYKDYCKLKSDKDFVEKKKKVEHLHSKLQHIKQLVHVYDTNLG